MTGIPARRGNIIRPLRDVTRKEIDEYASEYGVSHVFDSTNAIPDCSRNKLRLEVIPLIKELDPVSDYIITLGGDGTVGDGTVRG